MRPREGNFSHNEVEISPYLGHICDNWPREVLPNVGLFQAKNDRLKTTIFTSKSLEIGRSVYM